MCPGNLLSPGQYDVYMSRIYVQELSPGQCDAYMGRIYAQVTLAS